MKVLVVDDDPDFRALVRVLLRRSYPKVLTKEYDPRVEGLPGDDFPWGDYDVVLLDHELHAEHTGLDWLRRYTRLPGFPGVIFTTGAGDENLAARAMKFGADEYLSKHDLTAVRLGELVSSVIAERRSADDASQASPLPVSTRNGEEPVPGFELRRLLGCGGTADVYLAERQRDGLTVVLKILREGMTHDVVENKRLQAEAVALAAIDSAQVVRVYEHGTAHGRAYMVMEFMGHGDLRTRIDDGLVTPRRALRYTRSVARGLAMIHGHGLVHRDVKPSNVMFRYDDSLALTDFGIARHADRQETLTDSGSVVGTPAYMSPEQCEGWPADARSDLYSLGVMLFEMLDGARPYSADSASQLFVHHVESPIPLLSPELMPLQPLVERLMAKDPMQRFSSASALVEALDAGDWLSKL